MNGISIVKALGLVAIIVLSMGSVAKEERSSPRSLSIVLDNDIFVPGSRDQDYTAGFNIAYSGKGLDQSYFFLKIPLRFIDQIFDLSHTQTDVFSLEAGLYGFTPEDIERSSANSDDRPYASILYFSSAHERIDESARTAWQSVFTIGVLGLDTFGSVQQEIHKQTQSRRALGWHNQVSDGGEPTLRYQLARQTLFDTHRPGLQAKFSQQLSVGYLTEASVSVNLRYGKLNSLWWRFRPELTSYGEQYSGGSERAPQRFIFVGATLKARAYNVFLQGQLRDSAVTYSAHELNHLLLEMWAGYTHSFGNGVQFSYTLRGQLSEVKQGRGDRNLVWGGIALNKTWF